MADSSLYRSWRGASGDRLALDWVSWPVWCLAAVVGAIVLWSPGVSAGWPVWLALADCLLKSSVMGGEVATGAPLQLFCKVAVAMGLP